ncbi:DUF427 domain-containing protein [Nakamurella deserti]|uniref:DUF427 domain-containing protein n=1 Tax=Nakamurella deserti TaxID=2164074 RepID=UPI000DBEA73C|nr:DUF427 domain-containing protein [Nakamurella deserti]
MALDLHRAALERLPDLRTATTPKRVRARHRGRTVLDTTRALLVWEPRRVTPQYAVPAAELTLGLVPTAPTPLPPDLPPVLPPGRFCWHTTPGRAFAAADGPADVEVAFRPDDPDLDGRMLLDFGRFDWIEENQPVVSHPHDPFARIDVLASERHIRVELGGRLLAESGRPVALFETGLPVRYYLPREDLRMDLLHPSPTRTTCAYKGVAGYVSADLPGGDDIAWTYEDPLDDAARVRQLWAFWSERVELYVDGTRYDAAMLPDL